MTKPLPEIIEEEAAEKARQRIAEEDVPPVKIIYAPPVDNS